MSAVVFDIDARAEFLAAVAFYEDCQRGLGRRFRDLVEAEIVNIVAMPFRFRLLCTPFRRCLIPGFPYSIIFSIEPNFILVIAVAHTKRKPNYWCTRGKTGDT
ncbi:MAG: type II toxin-antitoxin system RelE/ParE family toxin [bacterium]